VERAGWIRYDTAYPHAGFSELCNKDDIFPYLGLASLPPVVVNPHHPAHMFSRSWMWGESEDLGVVFQDLTRGMDYRTERGFIHTVSTTLADWMKHGPAVVQEHPVARVVLADRRPDRSSWSTPSSSGEQFDWYRAGSALDTSDPSVLPVELFRGCEMLLERTHKTREDAKAALSDACLKWAKSQSV
jgi:hypothetical protein